MDHGHTAAFLSSVFRNYKVGRLCTATLKERCVESATPPLRRRRPGLPEDREDHVVISVINRLLNWRWGGAAGYPMLSKKSGSEESERRRTRKVNIVGSAVALTYEGMNVAA